MASSIYVFFLRDLDLYLFYPDLQNLVSFNWSVAYCQMYVLCVCVRTCVMIYNRCLVWFSYNFLVNSLSYICSSLWWTGTIRVILQANSDLSFVLNSWTGLMYEKNGVKHLYTVPIQIFITTSDDFWRTGSCCSVSVGVLWTNKFWQFSNRLHAYRAMYGWNFAFEASVCLKRKVVKNLGSYLLKL